MRIVVAMDSFKGSLTAGEACAAVERGLRRAIPDGDLVTNPLADGGEGTLEVLLSALGGRRFETTVSGPLPGRRVIAHFGMCPNRLAIVEMAQASGLALLQPGELDPLRTGTEGTGELLRAAGDQQPERIWLAVGGSATVDGGVGAARSLGWRFLDAQGREVGAGGGALGRIVTMVRPAQPILPPIEVLCDVDNPLCGPQGAARVFGPQKGASPGMVELLERNLEHLAALMARDIGIDVGHLRGAGAAGGLAAGAAVFLGASLRSGVDVVIETTLLADQLMGADWVVTGEGRLDFQSLAGKVVSGVVRLAREAGCRVAVVAGSCTLGADEIAAAGIDVVVSGASGGAVVYSAAEATRQVEDAAEQLVRRYLAG